MALDGRNTEVFGLMRSVVGGIVFSGEVLLLLVKGAWLASETLWDHSLQMKNETDG